MFGATSRTLLLSLATLLVASAGCRKRTPDEIVFAGKTRGGPVAVPTTRPLPTVVPPEPPPPEAPFSKHALLGAIADCSAARVRSFIDAARPMRDAARAYANDKSPQNASASKAAWQTAMSAWQELELFRFGPAAVSSLPGGRDLRDQIDAWPLFSRCKVDEQLVSRAYAEAPFGATSLVNGRGLAALEYLTFYTGQGNGCTELSSINTSGAWTGLGEPEVGRRRIDYAAAVADAALTRAEELGRAWDPAQGNFQRELLTAGAGGTVYASEQAALNAVSDALFYVDKELKDLKLGRPSGIFECQSETCPQALESPFARASLSNVRANVRGFRMLFQGCGVDGAGFGFDDWLRQVGAGDVADRMLIALSVIESTAADLEPSLEEVIAFTPAKARVLHGDVKNLTDILKTEFVTVLNLELPKVTEGDND